MPISKYGLQFPDNTDPRMIELALYSSAKMRASARGVLSKWEHLRNCIKGFLPDEIFRWHRWVDEFGEAWCEHTGVAVWGAGGTTKSGIVGCLAFFDLMAAPKDTLTVMVTNPQEKHWDRCFSKTLHWKSRMPEPWKSMWKVVISPKPSLLTLDSKEGSRRGILCISIDKGESGADIAKKVGAHAPRTRLILDEGQGLPPEALSIGVNLFLGSNDKRGVVIGNPCSWRNNALALASMPLDGDTRKIDEQQPDSWLSSWTWDDKPGKTLVFDGTRGPTLDSPEEAKRLSMMIQPSDIESRRMMPGGENTLDFWSQVRGRVPPAGSGLTIMSELDWDACGVTSTHPFTGPVDLYLAADLSLGGDKIPVYRFGVGNVANLGRVAQKLGRDYITIDMTKPDRSGQIAKAFKKLVEPGGRNGAQGIDLSRVALECSGQQGAIADTIEREVNGQNGRQRVVRIRTEEGVTDRVLSNGRVKVDAETRQTKKETAKDRYKDRATEVIMNVLEMIQGQVLFLGADDEVKVQVTSRGFDEASLDQGKTKVQKKKPWREAHGGQSPDELDSVACFCTMVLENRTIVPGKDTLPKAEKFPGMADWQRPDKKSKWVPKASRVSVVMRGR